MYIGITGQEPEKRWNCGRGYRGNEHFFRAIVKYGWDNIRHEILRSGLTKEEACEIEMQLISQYKSCDEKYGYNNSIGGSGGMLGYHHSEETKIKISSARRGKTYYYEISDETRKKLSEAQREWLKNNPEEIEKRRLAFTGANNPKYGKPSKNRRKVLCLELSIVFDSIQDASDTLQINGTHISSVARGEKSRHTAGGYHWKFMEEE